MPRYSSRGGLLDESHFLPTTDRTRYSGETERLQREADAQRAALLAEESFAFPARFPSASELAARVVVERRRVGGAEAPVVVEATSAAEPLDVEPAAAAQAEEHLAPDVVDEPVYLSAVIPHGETSRLERKPPRKRRGDAFARAAAPRRRRSLSVSEVVESFLGSVEDLVDRSSTARIRGAVRGLR